MAAYEVCIDTATALKNSDALAAIFGNMALFYMGAHAASRPAV